MSIAILIYFGFVAEIFCEILQLYVSSITWSDTSIKPTDDCSIPRPAWVQPGMMIGFDRHTKIKCPRIFISAKKKLKILSNGGGEDLKLIFWAIITIY